jgi:hypothetical protein
MTVGEGPIEGIVQRDVGLMVSRGEEGIKERS